MNNDEIKKLAREIAENSVDYSGYYDPDAVAGAYAHSGPSVNANTEPVREKPDELTLAIVKWAAMEIETNREMEKVRRRVGFITLFVCVLINLFILGFIVSFVAYVFIALAAI